MFVVGKLHPTPKPREPRISINKLGEYVRAPVKRRRSIVEHQKYPKSYGAKWYDYALPVARRAVCDHVDVDGILAYAERVRQAPPTSVQDQKYRIASADGLVALSNIWDLLEADVPDELVVGEERPPKLELAGLAVSVRPDVILVSKNRLGQPVFGLLKFHFSKTHQLDAEAGSDVATLLHWYGEEKLSAPYGHCERKLCSVVEVFGQEIYSAPRAVKSRREGLEAACTEIRLWWREL